MTNEELTEEELNQEIKRENLLHFAIALTVVGLAISVGLLIYLIF